MKLKVKHSNFSAGRPIAILNEKTAAKLSLHVNDRILIKFSGRAIEALIDLSEKIANHGEIVVSKEIIDNLKLKSGEEVTIEPAQKSGAMRIINKKIHGKKLSEKEIYSIIQAISKNSLTESEIAFFISAVYNSGMSFKEIEFMTRAMYKTGERLKLSNQYIVDKHSIGGIAGNRTSPIVVSICAAAGLIFPKNSSRSITSAAGTADTMETVCEVDFSIKEVEKIVKKTGACLVHGGALGFAPSDSKIIEIERMINIDPLPNLLSSIISKKLAAGSKYVLIDIPYGTSAKVSRNEALKLKKAFEKISKRFNLKVKCVLTDGNEPIGNGIGPVLEMRDIISVFSGNGPDDLRQKSVFLAGEIFELCKKTKKGRGKELAEEILNSGKAFNKFKEIVKAQKGNPENFTKLLTLAKFSKTVLSPKNIKIRSIDNKQCNLLARVAGSPNDKKAGIFLHCHVGYKLKKGEPILTIYSDNAAKLRNAVDFCKKNKVISFE